MTIVSSPTFFLLSLSKLKGVGPAALKKVAAIPGFDALKVEQVGARVTQVAKALEAGGNWNEAQDWAQGQAVAAERIGARILSAVDPEYPTLLAGTKDDPFILFVQGSLARPAQRSVAVIGTREPTYHGMLVATRITSRFAEAGWSIVSGLAIGCDGLAHQAALDCRAHTVAVLAHGLHMVAPAKHRQLAQDILASGGALVSEYPFGHGVQMQQYVKRDRTQAGLALGVVMVQSDIRGGSLYASRASLEYGRWLAVPYPTERDRENREPKVQANLVIAEGAPHERADLLRTTMSSLGRVIVLHGKQDYALLSESDGVSPFDWLASSSQGVVREGATADVEPGQPRDFFSEDDAASERSSVGVVEPAQGAADIDARSPASVPDEAKATHDTPEEPGYEDIAEVRSTSQDSLEEEQAPAKSTEEPEAPVENTDGPPAATNDDGQSSDARADVVVLHREDDHVVDVVEYKLSPARTARNYERQIVLYLRLPEGKSLGGAYGLWTPPKKGSKEFKKSLGDARDDREVRDFYARYKRLHTHLVDLQRKVAVGKKPRSHDQVLAIRLVAEEMVLHLAKLVQTSAAIELKSKALRQRVKAEDWIEQDAPEARPRPVSADGASEGRLDLLADLTKLLQSDLQSFVIDDNEVNSVDNVDSSEVPALKLYHLVERLNSVLEAAF